MQISLATLVERRVHEELRPTSLKEMPTHYSKINTQKLWKPEKIENIAGIEIFTVALAVQSISQPLLVSTVAVSRMSYGVRVVVGG